MENPKTSEWVTPKLVVKRRRKTTSARPEKIERTIDSCLEKAFTNNCLKNKTFCLRKTSLFWSLLVC